MRIEGVSAARPVPVIARLRRVTRPDGPEHVDQSRNRMIAATSGAPNATAVAPMRALSPDEEKLVRKLQEVDREVRAHEAAHVATAGPHARGGPSFTFVTGPDQKQYAVSGEVQIDTSEVKGDPQATIEKMQVVRRAALAPAQPSAQDRKVAAEAAAKEAKAREELAREEPGGDRAAGEAAAAPSPSIAIAPPEEALDPGAGGASFAREVEGAYRRAASEGAAGSLFDIRA